MTRRRSRPRRGYALPLIVLLTMVGATMTAVMLERQAAQELSIQRQLARYRTHHVGRGVREAAGSWLRTLQNEPVTSLIGADGHAFDIDLMDGRTIAVYLAEAQGTALADLSGLDGAAARGAAAILDILAATVGPEHIAEFTRPVGPAKINAATAPEEVLLAVGESVLGKAGARKYADSILKDRSEGKLFTGKLTQAANAAGATPEQRTRLAELMTDQPTLFLLTAEVRGPRQQTGPVLVLGATAVLDMYRGLVDIDSRRPSRGGTSAQELLNPTPFLTWEKVPEDAWGNE